MSDKYILEDKVAVECSDLIKWANWLEVNQDRKRVALTTIGDVRVSTVFLGLDHQFGNGPPLIFETLVFGGHMDEEMDRYSTWDEAENGHKHMVRRVKKSESAEG